MAYMVPRMSTRRTAGPAHAMMAPRLVRRPMTNQGRGFFHQDGRPAIIHPQKRYVRRPGGFGEFDLYDVYNEFGEYEGLLSKVRKVAKKVTKPLARVVQKATNLPGLKQIKKVVRTATGAQVGFLTLGLAPKGGKIFGIRSEQAKKAYRIGGTVGKVAAAVVAAPIVLPAVGAGLSAAGGALVSGAGAVGGVLMKGGGLLLGGLKKVGGVLTGGKPAGPGAPTMTVPPGEETGGGFDLGGLLRSQVGGGGGGWSGGGGGAPSGDGGEGIPPVPSSGSFLDEIPMPLKIAGLALTGFAAYKLLNSKG